MEYEGDIGWATWSQDSPCAECRRENTDAKAIGVEVLHTGDLIHIEGVCETHATNKDILIFQEDN